MKPGRRWLIAIGAVVLASTGLACLCRPRPQEYRWYVSPPLDAAGRRAKVLVPVGWTMDVTRSGPDMLDPNASRITYADDPPPRLVRWVRRLTREPGIERGELSLHIARGRASPPASPGGVAQGLAAVRETDLGCHASRTVGVAGSSLSAVLRLDVPDRLTFDRIHSTITRSLRIE